MSIHSRIRAARLAKELTEQQLADKVDLICHFSPFDRHQGGFFSPALGELVGVFP